MLYGKSIYIDLIKFNKPTEVKTRGKRRRAVNLGPRDKGLATLLPCGTARRSKRVEASSKGSTLTVERRWREERVDGSLPEL